MRSIWIEEICISPFALRDALYRPATRVGFFSCLSQEQLVHPWSPTCRSDVEMFSPLDLRHHLWNEVDIHRDDTTAVLLKSRCSPVLRPAHPATDVLEVEPWKRNQTSVLRLPKTNSSLTQLPQPSWSVKLKASHTRRILQFWLATCISPPFSEIQRTFPSILRCWSYFHSQKWAWYSVLVTYQSTKSSS